MTLPEAGEKLTRNRVAHSRSRGDDRQLPAHPTIEEADPDAKQIVALLDRIPGAFDRIEAGIDDVCAGRTIPFGS